MIKFSCFIFKYFILGLKIEINYMGKQKRKYKVNGVTEKIATQQMFSIEENGKKRSISVADYFKQEKKVTLQYVIKFLIITTIMSSLIMSSLPHFVLASLLW